MFATVYFSLSVGLFLSTFINTWKNQESLFVTCMVYQRSTLNSAVLFNLPICLTWLIMRVASRLISGHTVDDDYDVSRLRSLEAVVEVEGKSHCSVTNHPDLQIGAGFHLVCGAQSLVPALYRQLVLVSSFKPCKILKNTAIPVS